MIDNPNQHDDPDIIFNTQIVQPTISSEEPVISDDVIVTSDAITSEDDGEDTIATDDEILDAQESNEDISYDNTTIDFRGETLESLASLFRSNENVIGPEAMDARVKTVGSWENLVFRAIDSTSYEELRIQNAIANLSTDDRSSMSSVYKEDGKTKLRTSSMVDKMTPGEVRTVTGDAAVLAFECQEAGGGYRIPLYNSGITIDIITPTGSDIQTMLTNCIIQDRELGTSNGAHYFAYADLLYKNQIMNFIQPLIVNSSYVDWRKTGKLASVIKLSDLSSIIMTLAAIIYKDGFDRFVTKCTRPESKDHPNLCHHTETITANLFEMIVTRFSVMNRDSIDFMIAARQGSVKNTLVQIAKYQANLGFEGEVIEFDNVSFTMRMPTISEHLDAGSKFLADIINEIEGDNTAGQYDQIGFRYIRSFIPWIAAVEKHDKNGAVLRTTDHRVIIRELEKLDDKDDEGVVRNKLREYIDKTQLTYVGYPITPCPACGYTADTPSGMWTIDPFSSFFTLAFQYLRVPV